MFCAWNRLVLSQEVAVTAECFNISDLYNMDYIKDQLCLNLEVYSYVFTVTALSKA
jgi:hypothetical protein